MKKVVHATPTTSGNGFKKGEVYTFTHYKNSLYRTINSNGHERFEIYPFQPYSPHLVGVGHDNFTSLGSLERLGAGHFVEVEDEVCSN